MTYIVLLYIIIIFSIRRGKKKRNVNGIINGIINGKINGKMKIKKKKLCIWKKPYTEKKHQKKNYDKN